MSYHPYPTKRPALHNVHFLLSPRWPMWRGSTNFRLHLMYFFLILSLGFPTIQQDSRCFCRLHSGVIEFEQKFLFRPRQRSLFFLGSLVNKLKLYRSNGKCRFQLHSVFFSNGYNLKRQKIASFAFIALSLKSDKSRLFPVYRNV